MLDNGFPISGWLRWSYSAHSDNIVESKSAKLYLNSFNMAKMGSDIKSAIFNVQETVWNDFAEVLKVPNAEHDLAVVLHINEDAGYAKPMAGTFIQLEDYVNVEQLVF